MRAVARVAHRSFRINLAKPSCLRCCALGVDCSVLPRPNNPQDEKICGAITPSTVVDKMLSSGDYVTRKKYKKVGL